MRIFLHIGLEKTGTTAIQHSLWQARAALAGKGVLFPENLGRYSHTYLAIAAADCRRTEGLRIRNAVVLDPAERPRFAERVSRELARQVRRERRAALLSA